MQTFKDLQNREWQLSITIGSVRQVKEQLGVDLTEFPEVFDRLGADILLLCNVLYVLVKPQADKLGVTDEDFGYSLGGDVLEQATDVLLDQLIAFFPNRRRQILQQLKEKTVAYQDAQLAKAKKEIETLDLSKIIPMESGNSSTVLQVD
jgi:hypothetical protein